MPCGLSRLSVVAVPDAQPAGVLTDDADDVGIALQAPALQRGVDLLDGDARHTVELGGGSTRSLLHQQEAHHRDQEDHGDGLQESTDDEGGPLS